MEMEYISLHILRQNIDYFSLGSVVTSQINLFCLEILLIYFFLNTLIFFAPL